MVKTETAIVMKTKIYWSLVLRLSIHHMSFLTSYFTPPQMNIRRVYVYASKRDTTKQSVLDKQYH